MNSDYCSSDSEVEWEEVEDVFSPTTSESMVHTPSLEITVNIDGSKKKKTKNFLEKALDKFNKELKENLHKCNLLCLLAHGQGLNKQCNQTLVQAQLLSLLPHEIVADKYDKANIKQILDWFVLNHSTLLEFSVGLEMSSVQLAVALYRSVGIATRLVLNLAPLPFKTLPATKKTSTSNTSNDARNLNTNKKAGPSKKGKEPQSNRKRTSSKRKSGDEPDCKRQKSPYFNHTKQEDIDIVTDVPNLKRQKSPYFNHTKQKAVKSIPISNSSSDDNGDDLDYKPPQTRSGTLGKRLHSLNKKKPIIDPPPHSSDNVKLETSINSPDILDKKVDVSMSFYEGKSGYTASSSWIEVKVSGTWMTVHLLSQSVGSIEEAEEHSTDPLVYVVGIDGCGKLKDLTAKYAIEWSTKNRKWRIPGSWWSDTLQPYLVDDEEEDEEIRGLLLERPMPTNVAGFKDHPLYVLKRHLLKFEAIYPEESQVLGYCHHEPIYARECVHTLHTRETWLKQGRIVKQGEEAYMSVKARPKRGQKADEDRKVDVFGHWQTQVYTPPPVVDGKIQRNEYGNVELFQPLMLPKGACHIQLPGIHRIAKLLDIDCAPAMMGWDFSSGYCHPVIDGIVTAEENKPVLVAAWEQQKNDNQKKQQEKREKKIYERWRLLIRGVLLKERVQKRFETTE